MKRFVVIIIAVVITLLAVAASGCGEKEKEDTKSSKSSSSKASVTSSSETSATKETETKETKPTEATKETEKETTANQTESTSAAKTADDYKKILTRKKWHCVKCFKDGERVSIQVLYGTVIKDTGTYIEFRKDNTFKCVMGFEGCDGTYRVYDNGKLEVTKKVIYSGGKSNKVNQTETLDVEDDYSSLTLNLNGVDCVYTQ